MKPVIKNVQKILLIDDSDAEHKIFREALKQVDMTIAFTSAWDGEKAIDILGQQSNLPDIIFLDINMPCMNGFQCLKTLKTMDQVRHIPVIMYSTSSLPAEIEMAKKLGAIYFLTKPLYSDLVEVLTLLLKSEQDVNRDIVDRLLTSCEL